jgi:hypothetical protein
MVIAIYALWSHGQRSNMRTRNSRLLLVPLFFLRNQMMQSQLMLILLHAAVPAAVAPAVAAAAVAPAVAAAAVAPAVAAATVVPAVAAAAAAPGAAADPYQSIIGAGESVCSYASGKNTCFVYDSVLGGRGGGSNTWQRQCLINNRSQINVNQTIRTKAWVVCAFVFSL